ncbi:MAG: hypothetical protein ACREX4_18990 [Gammaproteobacteria bacterium]
MVQPEKNVVKPLLVVGDNTLFASGGKQPLEALVPEAFDHLLKCNY